MGLIPWRNKERDGGRGELSPLVNLRSEMERLFDSFLREPFGTLDWPFGSRGWSPAVDIAETEDEVTVQAEIPGIDPKDLEITVSEGRLVLAGEKKESTRQEGKDFYLTETRYGTFRRALALPEGVDTENVEAEYANGVLTIRLKKSPKAAAKRIEVKAKPT